ncbi:MAG TPA: hypothetical protein VGM54_12770 [Chthoniobacter sp.]
MKSRSHQLFLYGLASVAVALFVGCATNEAPTVLRTVGPTAPVVAKTTRHEGYLIVYTPIIEPNIKPDTEFYPHTAYAVYDSTGKIFEVVRNHVGAWDETPYTVSLPSGKYTIRAVSEFTGDVAIPVIIRGGRTTVVNFQRHEHYLASL